MGIEFDDASHTYTVAGEIWPSVTQIIPSQDFFVSEARLEECRLEGIDLHNRLKIYHDTGDTFGDPLLEAFAKWYDKRPLGELIAYETPMKNDRLKFCGTPDMVFERGIVDFKRSYGNSRRHALQLGAYWLTLEDVKGYEPDDFLIMTYDGQIKTRSVLEYIDKAKGVFKGLCCAWWARKLYEDYMGGAK